MPAMDVHEWILKENVLVYISTIIKYAGKSTKQKQKVLVGKAKERLRQTTKCEINFPCKCCGGDKRW